MKSLKWITALISLTAIVSWASTSEEGRYQDLQSFAKVLNIIEKYYVEPVEVKKIVQGAIKGMLRELDPHSAYMSPESYREFENETNGEFGGIGIEITIENGQLTIISPIEDTPAWQAGVQARDRILSINGQSTKGFTLVDASKNLKGRRGDPVVLTIGRDQQKSFDVTIIRGSIKVKSVKSKSIAPKFLHLKVTSFIENTTGLAEKAIEQHMKEAGGLDGIILDLRRNPGGLLKQATQLSDLFLKEGLTIVSTVGRNKDQQEVAKTSSRPKYLNFPMIVLIDSGSASASEIVAGALQDHKRALIMGSRSFGKGSVQSVMKLGDGSALKLTISRYYTPSGRSIQAEGVVPDLSLEEITNPTKATGENEKRREIDIENHLIGENEGQKSNTPDWVTKDSILNQAVNYLKVMAYKNSASTL